VCAAATVASFASPVVVAITSAAAAAFVFAVVNNSLVFTKYEDD
jgi:hypothetical protein